MTKTDQEKVTTIVVIGILIIIIAIITLWLAWIQFNRFWFWFDVVFIPLSLVALVISIIFLFKLDEWDRDFWYIVGFVSIVILLFSVLSINGAYQRGYSDEAIQTKASLENMLDDYTFILSVYTGDFKIKVQGMVLDEFNKALCEAAPQTPCEQVRNSYNEYQELIGWRESAEGIVKIWKNI